MTVLVPFQCIFSFLVKSGRFFKSGMAFLFALIMFVHHRMIPQRRRIIISSVTLSTYFTTIHCGKPGGLMV